MRATDVSAIAAALWLHGPPEPIPAAQAVDTRVSFISAPRDGWCLVLGGTYGDVESGFTGAQRLSRELKTQACFFATDGAVDSYAYSRFDAGVRQRAFYTEDGTVRVDQGARLPDEPARLDDARVRELARAWSTAAVVPREDGFKLRLRP